jgi:hypothetical protein
MYTRSVFISVGRRLGITTTLFLFAVSMQAAEITATITGIVRSGEDPGRIFGGIVAGKPFSLVFTFDDSKGRPLTGRCGNDGSGIMTGASSPGTAVLTIDGVAIDFGHVAGARSSAYRSVESNCSISELRFEVSEGQQNAPSAVKVSLEPNARSFTQNADWRAPLSSTDIGWGRNLSAFVVHRGGVARGMFSFTSVIIVKR